MHGKKQMNVSIEKQAIFKKMIFLFAGAIILLLSSIIYYGCVGGNGYPNYVYALTVLRNSVISIACFVFYDLIHYLPSLMNKDRSFKESQSHYWNHIIYDFSYYYGLVFSLLLPVGMPFYVIILSAIIAIFMSKVFEAIFSQPVLNPALIGIAFVQICFPTFFDYDLSSTQILLNASYSGMSSFTNVGLWNLISGLYAYSVGEPFALILLVLGIFFSAKKIIDFKQSLIAIVFSYLAYLVLYLALGAGIKAFEESFRFLLVGGLFFSTVFAFSDPIFGPKEKETTYISVSLAIFLSAVIRLYTDFEGIYMGILLTGLVSPIIDKYLPSVKRKRTISVVSSTALIASLFAVCLIFGLQNRAV